MSDHIEELIKEIAVKHGVAVGRDDPILILQTINARLMQDSAKAQQDMLDQYKSELEMITQRWNDDAKEKAERILNASLAASKDSMAKLMQEGAKEITTAVREEIDSALNRVVVQIRNARRIGIMNIVASCITFLSVIIVLWISFYYQ